MLKLSKKAEYAFLALQYMAERSGQMINAKQLASELELSFEFLSKALQSLMKAMLVNSQQGINGGYSLAKKPEYITLAEVVNAVDEKLHIVNCSPESPADCERQDKCNLVSPMYKIQKRINDIFYNTTIADLVYESKTINKTHQHTRKQNLITLNGNLIHQR
jgi:Rrf2 family protein